MFKKKRTPYLEAGDVLVTPILQVYLSAVAIFYQLTRPYKRQQCPRFDTKEES